MTLVRQEDCSGLLLPTGERITGLRRLTGGRSHLTYYGYFRDLPVICKLSTHQGGRLKHEFQVLRLLGKVCYPCPRALDFILCADVADQEYACLILSYVAGGPPSARSSFRRMGRRLGELHQVSVLGEGVPFRSVDGLGEVLGNVINALPRGDCLTLERAVSIARQGEGRPVLAHGDASPGNFLDENTGGRLIDFEAACRQPAAADIGRCLFVMEAEYRISLRSLSAEALLHGYRSVASLPTADVVAAWCVVEGLRIIQWRYENHVRPGALPPQQALAALQSALRWLAGESSCS